MPRKEIREAALACLQSPGTGFNARLRDIAAEHSIEAFEIDWRPESYSVIQAYVAPEDVDLSQIASWPAINIYTGSAFDRDAKFGLIFSGSIVLHIDMFVKVRTGAASEFDGAIERTYEAISKTLRRCLMDPYGGLTIPTKENEEPRQPAQLLGDGWAMVIPFQFPCEVSAS